MRDGCKLPESVGRTRKKVTETAGFRLYDPADDLAYELIGELIGELIDELNDELIDEVRV